MAPAGSAGWCIPSPTPTSVQVAEDVAGSPFGLKLNSVDLVADGSHGHRALRLAGRRFRSTSAPTNPNPGDQVSFTFNLPDGTTQTIQLTASNSTPPPTGSFADRRNAGGDRGELQRRC